MNKKFNLPEKDYYTRQEVAKRWERELDLVDYYINHGMLREAFITSRLFELQTSEYFRCESHSTIFNVYSYGFSKFNDFGSLLESNNLKLDTNDIVHCPKFAYLTGQAIMFSQDYDGEPYMEGDMDADARPAIRTQIMFLAGPGTERYIPVCRESQHQSKDSSSWNFNAIYVNDGLAIKKIILREELERFESGAPIGVDRTSSAQAYQSEPDMTKTTEIGYQVTIGLLAKLLGDVDEQYRKSDGSANIIAMARAADNAGMNLEGHRTEALKKRITSGINALKEIS